MTIVRIPTPLRSYTGGAKEVDVTGGTVDAALVDLTVRYPDVRRHLFDEAGGLRPYVNVFLNDEDIRTLQSGATPLQPADRLMIVPSIAGGTPEAQVVPVDHAALRANQASIILLLVAAFVLDAAWLAAVVALVMLAGTALGRPGFLWVYLLLRRIGLSKPDVLRDHPQPHRFAQGLGGAFLVAALGAAWLGLPWISWGLVWLVIALAAVNLFAGFCVGCRAVLLAAPPRSAGVPRRPAPVHLSGTASRERPMIERLLIAAGLITLGLLAARFVPRLLLARRAPASSACPNIASARRRSCTSRRRDAHLARAYRLRRSNACARSTMPMCRSWRSTPPVSRTWPIPGAS